jgi:hypothetical protein
MDRIISLLAALVGLIALGGAILVHVNGDVQRKELAAEVAELRSAIDTGSSSAGASALAASPPSSSEAASAEPPSSVVASAEPSLDPQSAQIKQLEDRIAELEKQNRSQASALAEAQARLNARSSEAESPTVDASSIAATLMSAASSEIAASLASAPSALTAPSETAPSAPAPSSVAISSAALGPTTDCIPSGTRFVGKPGDSFAICKTDVVIKIAAVADGVATIAGAGPIASGSFGDIPGKGCSVMVFSADATGFADLRVTCK